MTNCTAYLHVGAGKTGTSAIQAVLPSIRDLLVANGVYYPEDITQSEVKAKLGQVSSGNAMTLARLVNNNLPRPKDWRQDEAILWLNNSLDKAESLEADILFSNEHLQFGHPDLLRETLSLFLERQFSVKVIYYVRTAIDYSLSAYLQALKVGAFPSEANTTLLGYLKKDRVPFRRTLKAFEDIQDYVPVSIEVRNYDKHKDNLISDFVQQFLPEYTHAPSKSSFINRSLTPLEQIVFERLAKLQNGQLLCKKLGSVLVKQKARMKSNHNYLLDQPPLRRLE
jgi:hypothetical protein